MFRLITAVSFFFKIPLLYSCDMLSVCCVVHPRPLFLSFLGVLWPYKDPLAGRGRAGLLGKVQRVSAHRLCTVVSLNQSTSTCAPACIWKTFHGGSQRRASLLLSLADEFTHLGALTTNSARCGALGCFATWFFVSARCLQVLMRWWRTPDMKQHMFTDVQMRG